MSESNGVSATSKPLGRADVFAPRPPKRVKVEVPEFGGHVYVRELTGWERDDFEAGCVDRGEEKANYSNVTARFVALCTCDAEGKRLFTDDDAGQLGDQSNVGLLRIFTAARKLNGMGQQAEEEARGN